MMIILFLVFIGVIVGANIYLAKRFAFYFSFENARILYILFPLITIFMIFGTFAAVNSVSTLGHFVFVSASITMGFVLYLLIGTIIVDLVSLLLKTKPIWYGITALSIAAIVSIYGLWNASNLKLTEASIPISGLTKPVRAAHLTDTHLGHIRGGDKLQEIVDVINKQNVDVVFFTGDLLDGKIQLKEEAMQPLQNLDAPIYFVEGNHDEYTGVNAIKKYLKRIGVNVLQNEVAQFGELQIIGLNFMMADEKTSSPHSGPGKGTVQSTLSILSIEKDVPTVLLHHGPDGIKYAKEAGIDLYLAGHTHAGQLWPITHIAKMMFEVNRGLHDFNGTKVYVSQGTGTFGPPMRVGTDSELAILNLIPE
jgi:predicted MPP superfamily phosphohydrolase